MVKHKKHPKKRKSRQLQEKKKIVNKARINHIKQNISLVRKSSRLISNLDVTKTVQKVVDSVRAINEYVDDSQRPLRTQSLLLSKELKCADLKKEQLKQLGIFSCFCCNNYQADKACKLKGKEQELVNKKNMDVDVPT